MADLTIQQAFDLAQQHHRAGRLGTAEQIYRQILERQPNHTDALYWLGVAALQVGRGDAAAELIGRAAALRPNDAAIHCDLGAALKDAGRLDEAIGAYRRAIALRPEFAIAYSNLGNALRDKRQFDEAVAAYRQAIALQANFPIAYSNLGNALGDQGRWDEAIVAYQQALVLKGDFAEAHCNLGKALWEKGELGEAAAACRRAIALKADFAEAHYNLGNALKDLGKLDESLASYHRALELKPDYAEAHGNLGIALEEIGDIQGAKDSFRAALRHDSRSTFAHYKLAELLRGTLPEEDLAAQRGLLKQGSASGEQKELTDLQRLWLHFSLARALDARGAYAEAAEHLDQANSLQLSEWRKRGQEYDPKEYELLVNRMITVCTPDFFERVRGFGLESDIPVFVVGLPRSGTTLIEQILASHSQVFGAGEITLARDTMAALGGQGVDTTDGLRQLDRETAQRFAARHLERLRAFSSTALRIVDKMPENYLFLGLLASLFPRAKLIHCRRDLRDVAVSCWMTPFQGVRWANDQRHIASRFHEYQRIMAHWRKVLPVPLLEVDYEETVADLEGVARRLVAWCGLEWEPKCLEFHQTKRPVSTSSVIQVRQPVFKTSVGRWKHYEQALGSLFARLSLDTAGPVEG